MTEFYTDSQTLSLVEDSRATFPIQVGGRSGTPCVEIPCVNGNVICVTLQFVVKNKGSGNLSYNTEALTADATKMTHRPASLVGGNTGWQSCQRTDYYVVQLPPNIGQDEVTFEATFAGQNVNAQGGSFIMTAQIVGSRLHP